jgi:probable rRNA maturation factor
MISIEIGPELRRAVKPKDLSRAAEATLLQQFAPDADLTLVLTDDEHIQALDRTYLGIDSPTDVLAFPAAETNPETGRRYLGDIIISVPRAEAQSKAAGHSLKEELSLLVVHGVLHLLGFDHGGEDERTRMWAVQARILTLLGISPTIVHG